MVIEQGPRRDWRWAGRSDPLAAFGHELRNALTSLQEGLSLTIEGAAGPLSEGQRRLIQVVKEDVARIARMAQDMLAASRVRAGSVRVAARRADAAELARDVMRSRQGMATGAGVHLDFRDTPEAVWCHADPDLLRQALENLLENALRATPSGGRVAVAVRRFVDDQGESFVEVAVRDTGPGLSPPQLEQILSRGRRSCGSGAQDGQQGLGIGLAIVRDIVEQHGGQLAAESTPGEGSSFRMILPSDFRQSERWLLAHISDVIKLARAVGASTSVVKIGVFAPADTKAPWGSRRGLVQLPLVEQCLEEILRPSDTVVLGERSATLVLFDVDGPEARRAANRAVAALTRLLERLPEPYPSSAISFGVGSYPDDGESAADVVEAARHDLRSAGGERRREESALRPVLR